MTMEVYFQNLNSYLQEETKNLKRANQSGLDQENTCLIQARIDKVKKEIKEMKEGMQAQH